MNTAYEDFLASKRRRAGEFGHEIDLGDVHPMLHDWQAEIVSWAVHKGRAALWADTGLGKSFMQLQWAVLSGDVSLIVAPLAVSAQTVREATKLGIEARYVRSGDQVTGPGVWVTNYEMVERFDPGLFTAVVLDESGILKAHDGKTRTKLIRHFASVPHKLACTATPAPNDPEELTNQAEFLGVCSRVEMLAAYFIHDEDGWRLKGHAAGPMYDWLASWALALRRPSDIGDYSDTGYELPGLEIIPELIPADFEVEGQLFPTGLGGVSGRARVRKETLIARCERAAKLVTENPGRPWLLWTGLNAEADMLAEIAPGAVNVHGSMSPEEKAEKLLAFADGEIPTLVTKPEIAGWGLNFQNCSRMAFVGLSDSFEKYYQCLRRCHRYGQLEVVRAHLVLSELESQIAVNVARKEARANRTIDGIVAAIRRSRQEVAV